MTAATAASNAAGLYGAGSLVCLVWGTTYLGIRISLETMPPMLMGGPALDARPACMLAGWMALRGERLPPVRLWRAPLLLGFLLLVLGNGGVVLARSVGAERACQRSWSRRRHSGWPGSSACRQDGERLTGCAARGPARPVSSGILLLVWPELRATASGAGGRGFLARRDCAAAGLRRVVARIVVFAAPRPQSKMSSRRRPRRCWPAGLMMIVLGTALGEWGRCRFSLRSGSRASSI